MRFKIAVIVIETQQPNEWTKSTEILRSIGIALWCMHKAISCLFSVMPINWLAAYKNTYGDAGELTITLINLLKLGYSVHCAHRQHRVFY